MINWITAICEKNGINIHYTRTGGKKPPLILLHGLMGNGACWTPVAQALEEEYDVIMTDARGHGKSSVPNDGYRYEDHANDVLGLIEALGLSSPIVLGHSMGGMTAAMVAYRKQSVLGGLILADPTFLNPEVQREVYESDVAEQHRQFLNNSLQESLAEARTKKSNRSLEIIELIIKARHQTSMNAFQVLIPPNPEYKKLVSAIEIPCLLVMAETGVVSQAMAEEMQNLNPILQIERIAGVGHGLHFDRPKQFVTILQSFLCSI